MAVLRRSRTRRAGEEQATESAQELASEGGEEIKVKLLRTDPDAIIARYKEKVVNRKSAIRAHCVECMGGSVGEIARCTSYDCALWHYRMGDNPNDQRTIRAREKRGEV